MEIQPIVIGTAGHIDHGKSTLVQALTGVDPDRLKEEKERGLTIDLGFAPLELPDGRLVGIVDVPGHERFVRNMVAGASGVDLVLLVVAADDGVMPQTREHLQIMELLGLERGLIALTKIDMVEGELVDLAEEEVREAVVGTFLAEAPLVRVSGRSGEGLDELRELLFRAAGEAQPRSSEGVFRMPIQRVFTKRGFGTVVTGIPVSGEAAIGDELEILPPGERGKVRGLNAYKHEAKSIRAGHSSAINLSDIDHHRVGRGCVVAAPGYFSARTLLAARLSALPGLSRPLTNRLPIRFHTGTADPPGELILLDQEELAPGQSGLVQLRLKDPVICAAGDRFVLRLLSPVVTLGGGVVLEESRHRLKRFKNFVLEDLTRREESLGSPTALIEAELLGRGDGLVSTSDLAVALKCSRSDAQELLATLAENDRARSPRPDRWIHVERLDSARRILSEAVDAWFEEFPHRSRVEVRELRRRSELEPALFSALLAEEAERGVLEEPTAGWIRPRDRRPVLTPAQTDLAARVEGALREARFQPPTEAELAQALSAAPEDVRLVLESMADAGSLERIGSEYYLAGDLVAEARTAIVENCERHGRLDIPEVRDRLGTTRKYLMPLLDFFDTRGLTLRQGGERILKRH